MSVTNSYRQPSPFFDVTIDSDRLTKNYAFVKEVDEPVYITNIKEPDVSHLLTLSMSKMTKEETQDRSSRGW